MGVCIVGDTVLEDRRTKEFLGYGAMGFIYLGTYISRFPGFLFAFASALRFLSRTYRGGLPWRISPARNQGER